MRTRCPAIAVLCAALLTGLACVGTCDDTPPPYSPEYEKSVGQEAIAQVEAQYTLYNDEEALAKLTAMTKEIAAATNRPDVIYDVRLLDSDEVNAFSLPGGTIYFSKGLLDEVQSDDELAAVAAHEIGHNCTYDALIQAERNKDLFTGSVAAAIAAILLGLDANEISTVLIAGEFVRRGVLGGYSMDMERMADHHGAEFLMKTSYNPVGLLTFMERLAAEERRHPPREAGVFQTHPLSRERVELLADFLSESGVDINRRATTKWEPAKAEEVKVDGRDAAMVSLWGEDVFLVLTPGPNYQAPMARAEAIAKTLTDLLAAGMESYEMSTREHEGNPALLAREETIAVFYPEDAEAQASTQEALAQQAKDGLQRALVKESLDRLY